MHKLKQQWTWGLQTLQVADMNSLLQMLEALSLSIMEMFFYSPPQLQIKDIQFKDFMGI